MKQKKALLYPILFAIVFIALLTIALISNLSTIYAASEISSTEKYLTQGTIRSYGDMGTTSTINYSDSKFKNVFALFLFGKENKDNIYDTSSTMRLDFEAKTIFNPDSMMFSLTDITITVNNSDSVINTQKFAVKNNMTSTMYTNVADGDYTLIVELRYNKAGSADKFQTYIYTYNCVVDNNAPEDNLMANGNQIQSETFCNTNVTYSASDPNFCEIFYKKPHSTLFETTTQAKIVINAEQSNNGYWQFYATDNLGHATQIKSVYIDTEAPIGSVYKENETVESGSYVSANSIKYIATDVTAGLASCYVKLPGMTDFVDYVSGTSFTAEGTYSFYAVDKINNRSETQTITLDRGKPTGFLRIGNDIKQDGGYSNESGVSFRAEDNISGIKNLYIKYPNNLNFELYTADTFIVVEGEIAFYAEDNAHNQSDIITIIMDRGKPVGVLYANGKEIPSGTVTHDIPAMYSATDSISGVAACYIKTAEDSDYIEYINETEITEHNDYYFYCVDNAGNVSEVSTLSVDKDFPRVRLYRNGSQISELQALIPQTIDENFCFNIGDTIKIVLKDQSILHKSTCNYELNKNIVVTMDLPQYVEITTPSG